MNRNDGGRGSGLLLAAILLVLVIVALLFAAQMGAFGMGGASADRNTEPTADPVEQAQSAVDAVNEHIRQQYEAVEGS